MKVRQFLFTMITLSGIVSCGLFESHYNNIPSDIEDFVSGYSFDRQQATELMYTSEDKTLVIFWVKYGEGMDCPSGCIYSHIIGLKLANHIGWFEDNYFPNNQVENFEIFDVSSEDVKLFEEQIWEDVEADWNWVLRDYYLPMLARDTDTPVETLLLMIERMQTMTYRDLHEIILSNPNAVASDVVLQELACLPEVLYGYFPYTDVIDSAKVLLGDRFVGCE